MMGYSLFHSAQVGEIQLSHRVVLAPMTRCRANEGGVHTDLAVEYYRQRASVPGTLLISEPSYVSCFAEGVSPHTPGVYTAEQIAAWKEVGLHLSCQCFGDDDHKAWTNKPYNFLQVVGAVHHNGSYIFMQLWACGRAAELGYLRERYPDYQYVSASDVPMAGREEKPRPLTRAGSMLFERMYNPTNDISQRYSNMWKPSRKPHEAQCAMLASTASKYMADTGTSSTNLRRTCRTQGQTTMVAA